MKLLILITFVGVCNALNKVTISNSNDFLLFWQSELSADLITSDQFPNEIPPNYIGDLPESNYWYFFNQTRNGDLMTNPTVLDVTNASFLCIQMTFFKINIGILPLHNPDNPIEDDSIPGNLSIFDDCIYEYLEYGFMFQNTVFDPLNIFILQEVILTSDGPNFPNFPPEPPTSTTTETEITNTETTTDSSAGTSTTTDSSCKFNVYKHGEHYHLL